MSNTQLETALMFAGRANDINSLKSLARSESRRAEEFARMLTAVLQVSGPVVIAEYSDTSKGFSLVSRDNGTYIVRANT